MSLEKHYLDHFVGKTVSGIEPYPVFKGDPHFAKEIIIHFSDGERFRVIAHSGTFTKPCGCKESEVPTILIQGIRSDNEILSTLETKRESRKRKTSKTL